MVIYLRIQVEDISTSNRTTILLTLTLLRVFIIVYFLSGSFQDPPIGDNEINEELLNSTKGSRAKALASLISPNESMFDQFDFFPEFPPSNADVFNGKDLGLENFKNRDEKENDDPFSNIATRKPVIETSIKDTF